MLQIAQASPSATHVSADDAQDVVSCLYLLVQRYGRELTTSSGAAGRAAIVRIGEAMLAVLQVLLCFYAYLSNLKRGFCSRAHAHTDMHFSTT